jgi:sulfatase modifying factor 1
MTKGKAAKSSHAVKCATTKQTTNIEFSAFVNATGYVTDSEKYGWSFVFYTAVSDAVLRTVTRSVAGAEWWVQVFGADWRHPEGPDRDVLVEGRDHHPVVQVSWNDANAYCEWRGARLPTEAEWEYAAAGGVRDFSGRYPWGNEVTSNGKHRANIWQGLFPRQNTADDGFVFLSPVDAFGPQNEAGLYGVIGNTWEWVQDWWTIDHTSMLGDFTPWDPAGPANGTEKVKKGGSFLCHQRWCYRYRIAARTHTEPDSATMNNGFRCAR